MNNSIYQRHSFPSPNPEWTLFNFALIEIDTRDNEYHYRVFYRPTPEALMSVFFSEAFSSQEEAIVAAKIRVLRMEVRRSNEVTILTDLKTGHLLEQSHLHRNCFGDSTHPSVIRSRDLYKNPDERESAINQLMEQCCQEIDEEANASSYCSVTIKTPLPINLDGQELNSCYAGQTEVTVSLKLFYLNPQNQLLVETLVGLNTNGCCSRLHT
jgi:hypothetical protein